MPSFEEALLQIADIREQLAASTRFRGFAPEALGVMALLCVLAAAAQSLRPDWFAPGNMAFVGFWTMVLAGSALLLAVESFARTRACHGAMAGAMLLTTLRLTLPFAAVQVVLSLVICRFAPDSVWLLPGLWLMICALAAFCGLTNLPRAIEWAAGWFFVSGTVVLLLAGRDHLLTPWMMGVPFGVGYAMIAAILHRAQQGGARG